MRHEDVQTAIAEAERFLKLAKDFKWHTVIGSGRATGKQWKNADSPSRHNAAIRRASLDLTNALAQMRQS